MICLRLLYISALVFGDTDPTVPCSTVEFWGSTPTDQQFIETQINPVELLSNLNDALTAIVQLDFKIIDLAHGIIETRLQDTLCHFLGNGSSNGFVESENGGTESGSMLKLIK